MAGLKKIQTKRNEGAGSRQGSSKRRPLSFWNGAEIYFVFSLETALSLFVSRGKSCDSRIEALLKGLEQLKKADPAGKKRHSERQADPVGKKRHSDRKADPVGKKGHSERKADPVGKKRHSERKADPVDKKRHSERHAALLELYRQYAEAVAELRAIKKRGKELKKLFNNEKARLFIRPANELNLEEALQLMSMLEDVHLKMLNPAAKQSVEPSSPAESCSSNVVESFECSASIASGGSGFVDFDVNNNVHGRT